MKSGHYYLLVLYKILRKTKVEGILLSVLNDFRSWLYTFQATRVMFQKTRNAKTSL